MTHYRYTLILHPEPEEGGFSVTIPSLPGCVAQGETEAEAIALANEAIAAHIQGMIDDDEPIPIESAPVSRL